MDPLVSVILPTYNRSKTLSAAMASVLGQSYGNLELIVVDDASSEDIRAIVEGNSDERVRYIRRENNGGAGAARNSGLAAAKGRFIGFQDSDDLWLPGKLEKQIGIFGKLPDSVRVVTGGKILYGRDRHFRVGPGKVSQAPHPEGLLRLGEDQVGHLLIENRLSVQNALFRRDCMPDMLWFDGCLRANEDWEFAIRLAQHTKIYEAIEPVVLGFISEDSISSNGRRQLMGQVRILRKNRDVLAGRPRERSRLLLDTAIGLHHCRKRRASFRLLLAALKEWPASGASLIYAIARRAGRLSMSGMGLRSPTLRWER